MESFSQYTLIFTLFIQNYHRFTKNCFWRTFPPESSIMCTRGWGETYWDRKKILKKTIDFATHNLCSENLHLEHSRHKTITTKQTRHPLSVSPLRTRRTAHFPPKRTCKHSSPFRGHSCPKINTQRSPPSSGLYTLINQVPLDKHLVRQLATARALLCTQSRTRKCCFFVDPSSRHTCIHRWGQPPRRHQYLLDAHVLYRVRLMCPTCART